LFSLGAYDYDLPKALIAQKPLNKRDESRLMVLNRETGDISHHLFCDIDKLLKPNDVLVVNNTEVIPGRLIGHKSSTGGRIEVLLLDYAQADKQESAPGQFRCNCLVRASKSPKVGDRLTFNAGLTGEVIASERGFHTILFNSDGDFEQILYEIGKVPLPPYIHRPLEDNRKAKIETNDKLAYQTVYASQKGAIAAPTAGLHFTRALLERLKENSIKIVEITLHVGYGTFSPVRVSDIRDHVMHSEAYHISKESAEAINAGKKKGARIIAVGTTCVRTLETASDNRGRISSGSDQCDLFIYPGYRFKMIDGMITNFHLPRSTLLMLVSAFAGIAPLMKAYKEAIERQYRFYSYGDAMFIA